MEIDPHGRINVKVGIRYDGLTWCSRSFPRYGRLLNGHPETDGDQTLIGNFDAFGASSLDILVYAYTKTKQWVRFHEVKQEVLLKVAKIIGRHGAQIAFPPRILHIAPWPPSRQT